MMTDERESRRRHAELLLPTIERSPRIVLCEACGSEGCDNIQYDHDTGSWDVHCHCRYRGANPSRCEDACPYCEGTGGMLIATEPVELDDLEALSAGK